MKTFTLFYSYCGEIAVSEKIQMAELRKKVIEKEAGDHDRIERWARYATRGDFFRMTRVIIMCESPKKLSKDDVNARGKEVELAMEPYLRNPKDKKWKPRAKMTTRL